MALIRESVRLVMYEPIETQAAQQIPADRYERPRLLATQAGDVQLRIPKLRKGRRSRGSPMGRSQRRCHLGKLAQGALKSSARRRPGPYFDHCPAELSGFDGRLCRLIFEAAKKSRTTIAIKTRPASICDVTTRRLRSLLVRCPQNLQS